MIEQKLLEKACTAIHQLYEQKVSQDLIGLEKTKREIIGDYTLVVFPLLKLSHKSPEATAQEIGNYLSQSMPEIAEFNVIKGFLNLILSDKFWLDFLKKNAGKSQFGFRKLRPDRPVVLEFSSPNTNKPLHLGHIRNNLLGHSLSEILKANGFKVIKVNLVNDRGIHICKSMLAYQKWGNNETPFAAGIKGDHLIGKYYVLFNKHFRDEIHSLMEKGLTEEEAEKQAPLIIEAQEILRKWEARDNGTVDLWRKMNGWVYDGFNKTYQNLGISFDKIYYESNTYLMGKELIMEGLEREMLIKKEDGSIWADLRNEGLDEKLLLRSDGTSVYMTQDIGTAQLRYDDFRPSSMIYVVGNEQNYHFDVLQRILKKLGKEYASHIYHLSYGMVELPQGKMKSREGTVVDADDLMDEMFKTAESTTRELGKADELPEEESRQLFRTIGLGALKYFILKVDPKKNMLFDPKESIDFNGNTGPFIQYTFARIQSLLRKAMSSGYAKERVQGSLHTSLLPLEKETIKKLYLFPEIVKQAGVEMSPAIIANYVYDLAKGFNQFYQEIPVLKEENKEKFVLRLTLVSFTGEVIQKSMNLLGIDVPPKM
ncbi:MAG: arginine--tRNA ligase [Bacteroidales bacterium]|jgi:arginyl-tRNA synthetase|nr:arginine--tRNA ligase [Bacteroidales bacterium]